MRRDYVNLAILWFVLTFIGELLVPLIDIYPFLASEEGAIIDGAFRYLLIMSVPVFTFVLSMILYSIYRFRDKGESESAHQTPPSRGSTTVYIVWLLITSGLAVAILIHPGVTGLAELRDNSAAADVVVQVEAEQWNWKFTYPEFGVTIDKATELVLPVDKRVKLEVTATDVLHSFWVPAFRMKIDAVPGQTTVMYVTPNATGAFDDDSTMRVQCAEICGTGHARMRTRVMVVEADEFETWIAAQAQAQLDQTTTQ